MPTDLAAAWAQLSLPLEALWDPEFEDCAALAARPAANPARPAITGVWPRCGSPSPQRHRADTAELRALRRLRLAQFREELRRRSVERVSSPQVSPPSSPGPPPEPPPESPAEPPPAEPPRDPQAPAPPPDEAPDTPPEEPPEGMQEWTPAQASFDPPGGEQLLIDLDLGKDAAPAGSPRPRGGPLSPRAQPSTDGCTEPAMSPRQPAQCPGGQSPAAGAELAHLRQELDRLRKENDRLSAQQDQHAFARRSQTSPDPTGRRPGCARRSPPELRITLDPDDANRVCREPSGDIVHSPTAAKVSFKVKQQHRRRGSTHTADAPSPLSSPRRELQGDMRPAQGPHADRRGSRSGEGPRRRSSAGSHAAPMSPRRRSSVRSLAEVDRALRKTGIHGLLQSFSLSTSGWIETKSSEGSSDGGSEGERVKWPQRPSRRGSAVSLQHALPAFPQHLGCSGSGLQPGGSPLQPRKGRSQRSAFDREGSAHRRRRGSLTSAATAVQRMLRGWVARREARRRRVGAAVCPECGVATDPGSACLNCDHAGADSPGSPRLTQKRTQRQLLSWLDKLRPRRDAGAGSAPTHPRAWEDVDVFRLCIAGEVAKLKEIALANPELLKLRDEQGATPLHVCLLRSSLCDKHREIAMWIVQQFPERARDTYQDHKLRGQAALHFAVVHKDPELAGLILAAAPQTVLARAVGAFFSAANMCFFGEWPLFFAVSTNQPAMVRRILSVAEKKLDRSRGQMLGLRDAQGNTVLHLAVHHNLPSMYHYIHELCMLEPRPDFAEVQATQNKPPENNDGFTPLALAAYLGKNEVFQYLVEKECMEESFQYGAFRDRVVWLDDLDRMEGTRGALQILIERSHHQLLTHPILLALLQHKWRCVYGPRFRRRVAMVLLYSLVFVGAFLSGEKAQPSLLCEGLVVLVAATRLCLETGRLRRGSRSRDGGPGGDEQVSGAAHSLLVLAAAAIRWGGCWGAGVHADRPILALAALLLWARVLYFFLGFESTGPFVIMIWRMVGSDLKRFSLLFGTFVLGYSQAYYILQDPRTPLLFARRLYSSFVALLGSGEMQSAEAEHGEVTMLYPLLSAVLSTVYALLVTVLLVNLLIAMMSSTYSDIHEESDKLWNLEWARIIHSMECTDHARGQGCAPGARYWLEKKGRRFFCLPMVTAIDVNEYWGGPEPDWEGELGEARKEFAPNPGQTEVPEDEQAPEPEFATRRWRRMSRHHSVQPDWDQIPASLVQLLNSPMAAEASVSMLPTGQGGAWPRSGGGLPRVKSMDYRRNLIHCESGYMRH
eukprot:TRINITY_DN13116_c0_g1_i1.p1 TRINITY_DN13116_c0_g1~~TRINITY_DN13116_c0_g1_i1.p1  ORF type:complete len:1288 (+),score=385.27 TRINITY_DN13116_c0_g1_i1:66-3929(+)